MVFKVIVKLSTSLSDGGWKVLSMYSGNYMQQGGKFDANQLFAAQQCVSKQTRSILIINISKKQLGKI